MAVASRQGFVCATLVSMSFLLMPARGIEAVGIAMVSSQTAAAIAVILTVLRGVVLPANRAKMSG